MEEAEVVDVISTRFQMSQVGEGQGGGVREGRIRGPDLQLVRPLR